MLDLDWRHEAQINGSFQNKEYHDKVYQEVMKVEEGKSTLH
jgi:hypothetical protein